MTAVWPEPAGWRWRDRLLYASLWAVTFPTLVGMLAFARPEWDPINHGRPILLAAAASILLAAQLMRDRFAVGVAVLALGINALWTASAFEPPARTEAHRFAQPDPVAQLKVITFNMWIHNRRIDDAIRFLQQEQADLVLLLEVPRAYRKEVEQRLGDIYPAVHSCPLMRGCDGLLLSRYPMLQASYHQRDADLPPLVYARLQLPSGRTIDVTGTHMSRPNAVRRQMREIDGMIEFLSTRSGPMVLLGDFNLTPWSSLLARLERRAGMQRHATFGGSWPAQNWYEFPVFMIDHVLTSRGAASASISYGPRLGSDHLPVIARLTLQ